MPVAQVLSRPTGQGLKYHDCHRVAEGGTTSLSKWQKKKLTRKRQQWEDIFKDATALYIV